MRIVLCLTLCVLVPALTRAAGPGKFNKVLAIGDAAPAWKDLQGIDGKKHALADLKDKEIVIVVFTCNSCVVAEAYEDRIIAFVQKHAGPKSKVGFVAINVNTIKDDALPAMKARAAKKKFNFTYLYDPSQQIARAYGAMYTPEFFVFDRARKLVYTGSMDDKAPPGIAKLMHLENALSAALAGQPIMPSETSPAAGCRIRFNPRRDDCDPGESQPR